jgi:hypothetical protein
MLHATFSLTAGAPGLESFGMCDGMAVRTAAFITQSAFRVGIAELPSPNGCLYPFAA